jgi:hypothetical protein
MSVLCMLAWFGAAASLWFGSSSIRAAGNVSAQAEGVRGYRWMAGAALLWCVGLIAQQIDGVAVSLSFADLPALLAVAAAGIGIAVLAAPPAAARREVWAGARRDPEATGRRCCPGWPTGT